MISIGISGAPNTGKQDLADELEFGHVVADYVADFEERTGLAIGTSASYYTQMAIWIERFQAYYPWDRDEKDYVLVGTDLDGLAYSTILLESVSRQIQTPQTQEFTARYMAMAHMSVMMFTDQPRQTLNYILPKPGDPVDQKIRQLNMDLHLNYPVLTGTREENVERIMKDIKDAGTDRSTTK
jgi:hypothetical protein